MNEIRERVGAAGSGRAPRALARQARTAWASARSTSVNFAAVVPVPTESCALESGRLRVEHEQDEFQRVGKPNLW